MLTVESLTTAELFGLFENGEPGPMDYGAITLAGSTKLDFIFELLWKTCSCLTNTILSRSRLPENGSYAQNSIVNFECKIFFRILIAVIHQCGNLGVDGLDIEGGGVDQIQPGTHNILGLALFLRPPIVGV